MKTYCKLLSLTLLLFLAMPLAASRGRVQGYCQQGNQAVVTPGSQNSTTRVQRSYPACTVNVYAIGTTTHVTLYSDITGTAQANPFTATTSAGYWFFYTDSQLVDVALSGAGISTPFTLGSLPAISPTAELSDAPFATLAAACTVAAAQSSILVIGRVWNGLTTASYCQMRMLTGGKLVAAAGATLTMPVPVAPANQQIFDISAASSAIAFSAPVTEAYPQWFGAKGDGATNDSLAVQSAISAISAGGGGTMRFPYSASPYIAQNIHMASQISIQCDPGATVKLPNGFNGGSTLLFGSYGLRITNSHIKGCVLDGNRANQSGGAGDGTAIAVYASGWTDGSIEDNIIQNWWTDGIYVSGCCTNTTEADASNGLLISGNHITNSRRNNISVINAKNFRIVNNVIDAANGTAPQDGIDLEPNAVGHVIKKFVIDGNVITGNTGNGLGAVALAPMVMDGVIKGSFTNNAGGIAFFGAGVNTFSSLAFSPITSGNSSFGLALQNVTDSVISNYSIVENAVSALFLDTGVTRVHIGSGVVSGVHDIDETGGVTGNQFNGFAVHGTIPANLSSYAIPFAISSGGTSDTGTAWSQTTPVPTSTVGAITTASSVVRVKTLGKTAFVYVRTLVTTAGTGSGQLQLTLPFTSASTNQSFGCTWVSEGSGVIGFMGSAGSAVLSIAGLTLQVIKDGSAVTCNGVIETQ